MAYTPEYANKNVGRPASFSASDLKKVLSGKNVSMKFSVDTYNEEISGKSNVKDLETAMQLLYLNFTGVRKDDVAYTSFANHTKGILANLGSNPMVAFSDSVISTLYQAHPLGRFITAKDIETANYDTMLKLYTERFANAGNFIFTIVGNVKSETLKTLVEQYIASLPSAPAKAAFNEKFLPVRTGKHANNAIRAMEVPKSTTDLIYSGKLDYTLKNKIQLDAVKQILDIVLDEVIREKLGGTYGVQVVSEMKSTPKGNFIVHLMFDTDPERRLELVAAIDEVLNQLQKTGPSAANVQKVKEFTAKQHAENLKRNEYVFNVLDNQFRYAADFNTAYEQYVNQLSVQSLQKFAKQLFAQGNKLDVSISTK